MSDAHSNILSAADKIRQTKLGSQWWKVIVGKVIVGIVGMLTKISFNKVTGLSRLLILQIAYL